METIVQQFRDIRTSMRKNEVWRNVDFDAQTPDGLALPDGDVAAQSQQYQCNIPNLNARRITVVNGRCTDPFVVGDDGVSFGSLREAIAIMPDFVGRHLGQCHKSGNAYDKLNEEHFIDGVCIIVPEGAPCVPAFQIMSVTDSAQPLFLQARNLIVVGDNSRLDLVQCDDSVGDSRSMANNVTETFVGRGAELRYYKLQNMNDASGLLNHNYVDCREDAHYQSFAITLNGGHIRNHTEIRMLGGHCDVDVNGLYLIDKEQQADNYVFVDHQCPDCASHALFKGIADDSAMAAFNGHVLVEEGAAKTEANQSNRNILLNDKAHVQSMPFLEIYNDDVKCSHGSTTGQLDEQAMFYMRSRGIGEQTARTLLLYAFCDEVLQKIQLPQLRERLGDMVKKRLHGELTPCSECVMHCSNTCGCDDAPAFAIDPDKL